MIVGLVGNSRAVESVADRLAGHGFHKLKHLHEINSFTHDNLVLTNIDYEYKANALREKGGLIIHIVRQGDASGDYGVTIHPSDEVVGANGSFEGLFDRVRVAIDKRFGVAA